MTYGRTLSAQERDRLHQRFSGIEFDGITKFYPLPERLVLPYEHNNVSFEFNAMELSRPYLVKYQYILEGYDKEWSPLTNKTDVSFGNIPEGTYTFKLKAQSPFGVWSEPLEYKFTVLPPWYRTIWMYAVYILLLIGIIILIVWWNGRRLRARAEELSEEVRKATHTIVEQKRMVEEQKKLVEEKNKDILDSIHYAKRIQQAMLKEEEHIGPHLPEHFVLFMPKDIVSGDFYWSYEKTLPSPTGEGLGVRYWYLAAVDCTGHGVPGAMMSMLGMSFLNDIMSSEQLLAPTEILNRLRDKVVKELGQHGGENETKDGMDISLLRMELGGRSSETNIQWAGANNSLNLIINGEFSEIKGDKQPIGYHPLQKEFTNHEIKLQNGSGIYIFSDGYADQFGGPKGKKFKYKQLEELVLANHHLPMTEQKALLKKTFIDWVGNLEQIDDVCVIGVRL